MRERYGAGKGAYWREGGWFFIQYPEKGADEAGQLARKIDVIIRTMSSPIHTINAEAQPHNAPYVRRSSRESISTCAGGSGMRRDCVNQLCA